MELDGTTIALQIINFLVLVWLLKRFLYQPVLKVIADRQQGIEQALRDAQAAEDRAEALRQEYEHKLASLQQQHGVQMDRLSDDIATERERRLAALDQEIAAERERQRALDDKQAREAQQRLRRDADRHAVAFAARLLERLSGPELDQLLLQTLKEDLHQLPAEQAAQLRKAATETTAVRLTTARPLAPEAAQQLQQTVEEITGKSLPWSTHTDAALKSGLRIGLGSWQLSLSLADELEFFRREGRDDE